MISRSSKNTLSTVGSDHYGHTCNCPPPLIGQTPPRKAQSRPVHAAIQAPYRPPAPLSQAPLESTTKRVHSWLSPSSAHSGRQDGCSTTASNLLHCRHARDTHARDRSRHSTARRRCGEKMPITPSPVATGASAACQIATLKKRPHSADVSRPHKAATNSSRVASQRKEACNPP